MPAYNILVKIDQIVTKDVKLLIEADTPEAAKVLARDILDVYPAPIPYSPHVHRVVTAKAHYWIPKSIEFVTVEEDKDGD